MYHVTQFPYKYEGKIVCQRCFYEITDGQLFSTDYFASMKEVDETWFCEECCRCFVILDYYYHRVLEENPELTNPDAIELAEKIEFNRENLEK